MNILAEQMPDRELHLGIRQVDVFAGLNVLILLLELHRFKSAQLQDTIVFYPSGESPSDGYTIRLLKVIYYSDSSIEIGTFNQNLRFFLSRANLSRADLSRANLIDANLSRANLSRADLSRANLRDVCWNEFTNWENVKGLETALGLPAALKQHLRLQNSSS